MPINAERLTCMLHFNPLPFNVAFHLNGIHVLYSFTSPRDPARNDRAMTQVPSWVEPFRLQISHQMVSISLKIHPATFISYIDYSRVEEVEVARVPDHQEPSEAPPELDHLGSMR